MMEIFTAFKSIKSIIEIIKGFTEANPELQEKVQQLQSMLMDIQEKAMNSNAQLLELQAENTELKKQLKSYDDWEIQRKRYSLSSPWKSGGQLYALRRSHADEEPPHYLCTKCFHNRRKTILQPIVKETPPRFVRMNCSTCKSMFDTGYRGVGDPRYFEELQ